MPASIVRLTSLGSNNGCDGLDVNLVVTRPGRRGLGAAKGGMDTPGTREAGQIFFWWKMWRFWINRVDVQVHLTLNLGAQELILELPEVVGR